MIDNPTPASDVLVLRTHEVDRVKTFFEQMGMTFVEEQHGKGPRHWACERDGMMFEIYPVGSKEEGVVFYEGK